MNVSLYYKCFVEEYSIFEYDLSKKHIYIQHSSNRRSFTVQILLIEHNHFIIIS